MWLLLIVAVIGGIILFKKFGGKIKRLSPFQAITVITGAVKSGKTTLAVYLAVKEYRRAHLRWRLAQMLGRRAEEEPILYSNIPLTVPYCVLTRDILMRKKRMAYHSVVLIDEASLVADSMFIRDTEVNNRLLLFFKLFAHETHGGKMFINTQSIQDLHFAIKRCCSSILFVNRTFSYFPFVLRADVIEHRYSEDGSVVSVQKEDLPETMKHAYFLKKYWRYFDTYAFSSLTDNLPVSKRLSAARSLKVKSLQSFRDWSPYISPPPERSEATRISASAGVADTCALVSAVSDSAQLSQVSLDDLADGAQNTVKAQASSSTDNSTVE